MLRKCHYFYLHMDSNGLFFFGNISAVVITLYLVFFLIFQLVKLSQHNSDFFNELVNLSAALSIYTPFFYVQYKNCIAAIYSLSGVTQSPEKKSYKSFD